MLLSKIRSLANKALVVGALGLAALGSAQATIVVGVWDPAYGFPFEPLVPSGPALGWRGKIVVDVSTGCLNQPTDIYDAIGAGPCAPSPILELKVELYDVSAAGQPTLQTLDFAAEYIYGVDKVAIASPGQVLGFDTFVSSPITSTIALAQFLGVQAQFTLDLNVDLLTGPEIVLAWTADVASTSLPPNRVNRVIPEITFTTVPEPTGLLLVGGSLLALGWTRRRRQS